MLENGRIIGVDNTPTTDVASGIWGLREATRSIRDGIWPVNFSVIGTDSFENDDSITTDMTYPAGIADGDQIFIWVRSNVAPNTSTGFTQIANGTVTTMNYSLQYKQASSEGSTVTVSRPSNSGSFTVLLLVARGSGYELGSVTTSTNTTVTASSVTPTVDGLAIAFFGFNGTESESSGPSGWDVEDTTTATATTGGAMYAYSKEAGSGVATGDAVSTISGSQDNAGIQVIVT